MSGVDEWDCVACGQRILLSRLVRSQIQKQYKEGEERIDFPSLDHDNRYLMDNNPNNIQPCPHRTFRKVKGSG